MRRVCVIAVAIATASFSQAGPAEGRGSVRENYSVEKNISYSEHPETVLDVYQPKTPALGKRRPGVIVIHGGGWIEGSKDTMMEHYVLPYLAHGFVVCNVEYRLAKVAKAPAAVNDALAAAAWFRQHAKKYNVDRKRIVATGGSAGGHLALMVGMATKSAHLGPLSKVAAVVNFCGITDVEDQLQGANIRDYAVQWIPTGKDMWDVARRVSPVAYIRESAPAILTIHGTADETVPYEEGVELTRALRNAGGDAELIPVPNGGHGFTEEEMSHIYPQIWDFLRKRDILR
jgi:acetyl esterase/lipase